MSELSAWFMPCSIGMLVRAGDPQSAPISPQFATWRLGALCSISQLQADKACPLQATPEACRLIPYRGSRLYGQPMTNAHTETTIATRSDTIIHLDVAGMSAVVQRRSGLHTCADTFLRERSGRVAFLGGSITRMLGWSQLIEAWLRTRFPDAKLEFVNAAIGGTNSTFGAFRFEEDVLRAGSVDLLFLEFAVNDGGSISADNQRQQAMEGIIRKARRANPAVDILVLYLADEDKTQAYRERREPLVITQHEQVMAHYDIPVVNLALEMTRRLEAGRFAWRDFSGDSCHPTPFGHEQYLDCLSTFLHAEWTNAAAITPATMRALPPPLFPGHLTEARLIGTTQGDGWSMVRGWQTEKVCNFHGPVDVLTANAPGDILTLTFSGSILALSAIAGSDAGILEIAIDGRDLPDYDLFDEPYCAMFHRPVFHVLVQGLPAGIHSARLRMSARRHPSSTGHAARVLQFGIA